MSRLDLTASGAATPSLPTPASERRQRGVLLAVLALVVALATGVAGQQAREEAVADDDAAVLAATAFAAPRVVRGAAPGALPTGERVVVTLDVAVLNAGGTDLLVVDARGSGGGLLEARLVGPGVAVPAGRRSDVVVTAEVECRQPAAGGSRLVVGVERADGRGDPDVADGADVAADVDVQLPSSPVMAQLCGDPDGDAPPLVTATAVRDGEDLLVELASPWGWPATVTAVSAPASPPLRLSPVAAGRAGADGADRDALELPARGGGVPLRLQPPQTCPSAWTAVEVPSRLVVELRDGPTTTRVAVPVGPELARWLLDTACADAFVDPASA